LTPLPCEARVPHGKRGTMVDDPTTPNAEAEEDDPDDDSHLGTTLVREGTASHDQVREGLEEQKKLATAGVRKRLGEILVDRKVISSDQLQQHLHLVGKQILHCSGCRKRFNVKNWRPERAVACPKCGARLVRPAESLEVTVEGSQEMPTVTEPAPAAARTLGRYRILEEVGRGGMGIVWKAWDSQLKRVVALKEVMAAPNDAGRAERFLREAQMAARLRHPNIVTVHDVGSHAGTCYLTQEYVPGVSLDHVLAKGPLPFRRAVQIAKTCAEALYSAHQQRILHRDVKPANILLDDEGRPYITDFGLAKDVSAGATHGLTLSGDLLGTPVYMSPEQASGRLRDMGPASDQFSLGVVLYEMLTGHRPFGGNSLVEILNAIIKSQPRRPREINEKIPLNVEATCLKALAKDPTRRYPSLAEMASDLGRFLEEKLLVEPPSVPQARPPDRRKKTAVVVPPARTPQRPRTKGTPVAAIVGGLTVVAIIVLFALPKRESPTGEGTATVKPPDGRDASREAEEVAARMKREDVRVRIETQRKRIDAEPGKEDEVIATLQALRKEARGDEELLSTVDDAVAKGREARIRAKLADADLSATSKYAEALQMCAALLEELGTLPEPVRIELRKEIYDQVTVLGDRAAKAPMETEERRALRLQEAQVKVDAFDYEGAIADLTQLLKAGPDDALVLNLRAIAYYGLGEFVSALADADRACDLAPDNSTIHLNRGQDRFLIGDLAGAREDFDKVLQLDRASIEALQWRSRVRLRSGEVDGAISDAEEWSKIAPDDPVAHVRLAYALDAKGDTQKAAAEFGVAQEGLPTNTDSSYMRAYLAAVKAEGGKSEWIMSASRARQAWQRGEYAAARQWYERALQGATKRDEEDARTRPILAVAHVHLAFIHCLLSQGRTSPAVREHLISVEGAKRERAAALDSVSDALRLGIGFATFATDDTFFTLQSEGRWIDLEVDLLKRVPK